jgi:hypothetical protein
VPPSSVMKSRRFNSSPRPTNACPEVSDIRRHPSPNEAVADAEETGPPSAIAAG